MSLEDLSASNYWRLLLLLLSATASPFMIPLKISSVVGPVFRRNLVQIRFFQVFQAVLSLFLDSYELDDDTGRYA
jgi:hypothetical protein